MRKQKKTKLQKHLKNSIPKAIYQKWATLKMSEVHTF